MKVCPKCGKENADIATTCIDCDTNLEQSSNNDAALVSEQEKREFIRNNKYSKIGTAGFIVSIIGLCITAISFIPLHYLYLDLRAISFDGLALAIVSTVLGKKGIFDGRGKSGMIMGIIGIFASLVAIILYFIAAFNQFR